MSYLLVSDVNCKFRPKHLKSFCSIYESLLRYTGHWKNIIDEFIQDIKFSIHDINKFSSENNQKLKTSLILIKAILESNDSSLELIEFIQNLGVENLL